MSDFLSLFNTLIALIVGLGLVAFSKRRLNLENGAFLVAILFAPLIMFLGLSGRLLEFKGLGMEAKFNQVASRQVTPSALKPRSASASEIQDRSAGRAWMGIGSEVVLLEAREGATVETRKDVNDYAALIYPGLLQGNFEMLVVLGSGNRVLGYFPRYFFLDLLRIEIEQTLRGSRKELDSKRVGEQLEQTQLWDIVEYPRLRAELSGVMTTVRTTDTNAYALSVMADAGLDSVVVLDNTGAYAGIVKRKDVVADLLLALTTSTSVK